VTETSPDDTDRPRGILTPADRQFLKGETDYSSGQSERDARYRIRERFYNGILDLEIALRELESRDISMVMDRLDEANVGGIVAFAEYLEAATTAEKKREQMLTALDRERDTDTEGSGGGDSCQ